MVMSGTYAIRHNFSTASTADAVPKGGTGTTGDVPETAAAFTVQTTTPHRIGASLNLAIEDIASLSDRQNFESLLRQHISVSPCRTNWTTKCSTATGANDDLIGIFERLTDPSAPAAGSRDMDALPRHSVRRN